MPVVRLFAAAAAAAGTTELRCAADSLPALREALGADNAALAQVLLRCSFLADGLAVQRDASLADVVVVDVLPPFAGG